MKKQRYNDGILLIAMLGVLLLFTCGLVFFPAPRFSESENRLLAEKPQFSRQRLADGSYTAAWDSYMAERTPGRRLMRGVRAGTELALGKREVGGVLLCSEGVLVRRLSVNTRAYERNLKDLAKLSARAAASDLPCTIAVPPRRIDVCGMLPRLFTAKEHPEERLLSALPAAIWLGSLTDEQAWYKTDHHWTTAGAFAAYEQLADELGYTPYHSTDFNPVTVSEAFFGTTDAAAGILGGAPDSIVLWRYAEDEGFSVTKNGRPAVFTGFYDWKKLDTRDGYGVFFGGNDAVLEISQGANDPRETLLVIKDSFANALLPFLARHYRIIAVDPRYSSTKLDTLLPGVDRVLVLCGMQTLTESAVLGSLA